MTTAAEWQARLANMDNAWNDAEAATGGGYDPPDGDYQGTVYEFDFIDTDHDGAFLKVVCQVENHPTHTGWRASQLYTLEHRERIQYTKGVLALLGVDVQNTPLSRIYPGSPVLEAVLDTPVLFAVKRTKQLNPKTNQPYVNVYINKRLGGPISQGAGADFTPSSDVPFDTEEFQTPTGGRGPIDDDDIPF